MSNLDFDGMKGDGVNRAPNRLAGNKWGGKQNPDKLINEGRGPTKGNQDHKPMAVGKPATKDAYRAVPSCHEPAVKTGRDMFPASANPQYRGQGGTQATGYKNPDRINMSGYSMGNGV